MPNMMPRPILMPARDPYPSCFQPPPPRQPPSFQYRSVSPLEAIPLYPSTLTLHDVKLFCHPCLRAFTSGKESLSLQWLPLFPSPAFLLILDSTCWPSLSGPFYFQLLMQHQPSWLLNSPYPLGSHRQCTAHRSLSNIPKILPKPVDKEGDIVVCKATSTMLRRCGSFWISAHT